jgi:hypothetical protein
MMLELCVAIPTKLLKPVAMPDSDSQKGVAPTVVFSCGLATSLQKLSKGRHVLITCIVFGLQTAGVKQLARW